MRFNHFIEGKENNSFSNVLCSIKSLFFVLINEMLLFVKCFHHLIHSLFNFVNNFVNKLNAIKILLKNTNKTQIKYKRNTNLCVYKQNVFLFNKILDQILISEEVVNHLVIEYVIICSLVESDYKSDYKM